MSAYAVTTPEEPPSRPKPAGHWLWAAAVAATVFFASGQNHVAGPGIVGFDKVAHFHVFGLIATLVGRSFHRRRWVWFAILVTSAYGAGDEFRQSFTAGRSVEVADWLADTLGACLAVTLYQCWPWYRRLLETPVLVLLGIRKRQPQVEKSTEATTTEGAPST